MPTPRAAGVVCGLLMLSAPALAQAPLATGVHIVPTPGGYGLIRNGNRFFAKGTCGASLLDRVGPAGGNAVRLYGTKGLEQVQASGLVALVGLDFKRQGSEVDYLNAGQVAAQRARLVQKVRELKSNPTVLMWVLGNETESSAKTDTQRLAIWRAMNDAARAVKAADPDHPVTISLAGTRWVHEVSQNCPDLDLLGVNTYGGIFSLASQLSAAGWRRPYVVTEFGPIGHWEAPHTPRPWNTPIEADSTSKAATYRAGYAAGIANQPRCLGSFVFLWGHKQEKTHTWFGMFLDEDDAPVGAVDAMTLCWTGKPPADLCPAIGPKKLALSGPASHEYAALARINCELDVQDPEGKPLAITFELRRDVADAPQTGGDPEPPTEPLAGAVVSHSGNKAVIALPAGKGNYRIFAYARDPGGRAATVNVPVRVP